MSGHRLARSQAVLACAALALTAAACGGSDAVPETEGGHTDIEIAVTHWPSLGFAVPYHVAIDQGCFEREGINVTGVVAGEGGGTTVRSVLGGDLAFGEAATSAIASSYLAGGPIVVVGGGVQGLADILWATLPDSDIQSIEDLPGHSAGFSNPGSVTESVLAMSLENAGIPLDRVDRRATGGISEGLTALDARGIDATVVPEPLYSEDPDKYRTLWRASDVVPDFQQTAIFTNPDVVEENPDLVRGFLAARACAVDFMRDNPEETARIWAREGDIEPQSAQRAVTALLEADHWGVGLSGEGVTAAERGMRIAGTVEEGTEIPWQEFVNQDFLPDGVQPAELP